MIRVTLLVSVVLLSFLCGTLSSASAATANSSNRTQCDPVCCYWVGDQVYFECHSETFNCTVWCDLTVRCLGGIESGGYDVEEGSLQFFQVNAGSYEVVDCRPEVQTGAADDECASFADQCTTANIPPWLGCNGFYDFEVQCEFGTGMMQIVFAIQQVAKGN